MNSAGHPPLVAWVTRHVGALHAPPRRTAHLVTSGNTCAIDLVLRTLLNRGDCALVEEFTYSATLQARARVATNASSLVCAFVTCSR